MPPVVDEFYTTTRNMIIGALRRLCLINQGMLAVLSQELLSHHYGAWDNIDVPSISLEGRNRKYAVAVQLLDFANDFDVF